MESFGALFDYLQAMIKERRSSSVAPDDMVSRLMRRPGRPLDQDEDDRQLVTHIYQLMAAGYPTTACTIAIAIYRLLAERDLWRQVVADRSLISLAREEALRYGSAIRSVFRTATRSVRLDDVEVPEGRRLVLSLESVNYDELVFGDPGRFRLNRRRQTRRHLAFGTGVHLCLGLTLARTEIDIALTSLARRLPTLELQPEFRPLWKPVGILNGLQSVPVHLS